MSDNRVKYVVSGVLLFLAVLITIFTMRSGDRGIGEYKGVSVYFKCINGQCGHVFEMDKDEYLQIIHEKYADQETPLDCPECGDKAVKCIKCSKCSYLFVKGSVMNDFVDRCPKCGYSEVEQARGQ